MTFFSHKLFFFFFLALLQGPFLLVCYILKMKPPVVTAVLVVLVQVSHGFPALYHRGWWRLLREGDDCGKCELALCSEPKDCPAGTVLDRCGCCPECGNVEGQICDLDQGNHFYGQCGDNLECRLDADEARFGEVPEPQCVCKSQESICGPEGKTYENICQFNKAYATKRNISMKHKGPCESGNLFGVAFKLKILILIFRYVTRCSSLNFIEEMLRFCSNYHYFVAVLFCGKCGSVANTCKL